MSKNGFTLAEVLITLGIIGVVAAITMPSLIKHYQQQVVISRLKKFYTNINQAIKMSEVENGSCENWDMPTGDGNYVGLAFFNKYLANYLKYHDVSLSDIVTYDEHGNKNAIQRYLIKFADGSAMTIHYSGGIDISFYIYASKITDAQLGKNKFSFDFEKNNSKSKKCSVEPYTLTWDGTREHLKTHPRYGCSETSIAKTFCAKLIQYDGWKISKDYPW